MLSHVQMKINVLETHQHHPQTVHNRHTKRSFSLPHDLGPFRCPFAGWLTNRILTFNAPRIDATWCTQHPSPLKSHKWCYQ